MGARPVHEVELAPQKRGGLRDLSQKGQDGAASSVWLGPLCRLFGVSHAMGRQAEAEALASIE